MSDDYARTLAALASDPDGMLRAERAAVRWASTRPPCPAEQQARMLAGLMASAQAWPTKAAEPRQSGPESAAPITQPAARQKPLAAQKRASE